MREKIDEEVSVVMYYSAKKKIFAPYILSWRNREYYLGSLDYYHNYMAGQERQHVFELCDKATSLWFRLRMDGKNLHWVLEAIHDGLAN